MEQEISSIKTWLKTGSINIFGLPMSGKDTNGIRLAEALGGKFLSSGMILREAEKTNTIVRDAMTAGLWTPTDQFYQIVLPYFGREDLADFPLILGGIGRWSGEEQTVMSAAASSGHPIKAAILLNISAADVRLRWEQSQILGDRGVRADDQDIKALESRIHEFNTKTMPVIQYYSEHGLLVPINADQSKEAVFTEILQKLSAFAKSS